MILEAISGYIAGYLDERLTSRKMAPWKIALIISTIFLIVVIIHTLWTEGAYTLDDLYFQLLVFTPLYLILWALAVRHRRVKVYEAIEKDPVDTHG